MRRAFYWIVFVGVLFLEAPLESKADLIDHWKFHESSGPVARDSGGAVHNIGTWADAGGTELSWTPGLIGNAAVLTGAVADNYFADGDIEAVGATQLNYWVWSKPNLMQSGS